MTFEQFKALETKARMLLVLRTGNDSERLKLRGWCGDIIRAERAAMALHNEEGWANL